MSDKTDDWERSQGVYPQARGFTPGKQETQIRTTERGVPRTLDLVGVIHNDAAPGPNGQSRVDLMIDSGRFDRPGQYANPHLVNAYDPSTGVSEHSTLYGSDVVGAMHNATKGGFYDMPDRQGGAPGGRIFCFRAQVVPGPEGDLVLDPSTIQPGREAPSRYLLHDIQEGANLRAQELGVPAPGREASASAPARAGRAEDQITHLGPDVSPPHPPLTQESLRKMMGADEPAPEQAAPVRHGDRVPVPRRELPIQPQPSSQAGLASYAGGVARSLPSVPAPGEPGSRFNPVVREREAQPERPLDEANRVQSFEEWQASQAAVSEASKSHEGEGVATAATNGFVNGAMGGVSAASKLDERFAKHPELRDVGTGTSVEQRHPELFRDDSAHDQQAGDDGLSR